MKCAEGRTCLKKFDIVKCVKLVKLCQLVVEIWPDVDNFGTHRTVHQIDTA